MKVISLFSGIGAFEKALTNLGIEHEVIHYCEIDKYAAKAYSIIHEVDESKNLGDITKVNIESLPIDIDLITHGSPCQDFSIAGKGLGADGGTRSSLMWNSVEIIKHCRPKFVIWENVKNVISKKHKHNFDKYINELEKMGYKSHYKVLNAKNYGVPQNRERIFVVSTLEDVDFIFPEPFELKYKLKDLLQSEVDEKYYISSDKVDGLIQTVKDRVLLDNDNPVRIGNIYGEGKGTGFAGNVWSKESICPTLTTMQGGNRQPMIVDAIIGSTQKNAYVGDGSISSTLTSAMGKGGGHTPMIVVKNNNKKGYDLATVGDTINIEQPSSTTRRGRVGHGVAQTLNTGCHQVTPTEDFRIRKLTPTECWRLMGFSDEDIHKCIEHGISNSQLYKMAGNSIVVNVLMEIYKNLLF